MRLVVDTNVLVAAFVAHGTCADLLEHCVRTHELVTSAPLLAELRRVLVDKFGQRPADAGAAVALLDTRMHVVVPADLAAPLRRDRDDDVVVATALAGEASAIVTGDQDLLVHGRVGEIQVVSPRDFWRWEATR